MPDELNLSNRTKLHDECKMPVRGSYFGEPLGDIPDSYWRWFLRQPWCEQYPDLVQYAKLIEDEDE